MTVDERVEFERRLIAASGKYGHEHNHEFERILDDFAEQIATDILESRGLVLGPPGQSGLVELK